MALIPQPPSEMTRSGGSICRRQLRWARTTLSSPAVAAVAYLLALSSAEFLTAYVDPRVGLWANSVLLMTLLAHAALIWRRPLSGLCLCLSLAPLIRIVSSATAITNLPLAYTYLIAGLPLALGAAMVAHQLGLSRLQVGLTLRRLGVQLLVGGSGLVLGGVEYLLLRPAPMVVDGGVGAFALSALILMVFTGLVEEVIFRGLLQHAATEVLGPGGMLYVAVLYAAMHMGHHSWSHAVFVLVVATFYAWVVTKTRSIVGVALAHGLTNAMLLLVMPTLAPHG